MLLSIGCLTNNYRRNVVFWQCKLYVSMNHHSGQTVYPKLSDSNGIRPRQNFRVGVTTCYCCWSQFPSVYIHNLSTRASKIIDKLRVIIILSSGYSNYYYRCIENHIEPDRDRVVMYRCFNNIWWLPPKINDQHRTIALFELIGVLRVAWPPQKKYLKSSKSLIFLI